MTGEERMAVVSPYVAQWLLRQGGVDSRKVRETAAWLRSVGRPDLAEQLAAGVSQLLASAEEHRATISGTAEPLTSRVEAVSGAEMVTVASAAELLGCSTGMVRRLCRTEHLTARHSGGRPWQIRRSSISDLLEARRSA